MIFFVIYRIWYNHMNKQVVVFALGNAFTKKIAAETKEYATEQENDSQIDKWWKDIINSDETTT